MRWRWAALLLALAGPAASDGEPFRWRTDLEAARLMLYRAADALDRADPHATKYAAMAKRYSTDLGFNIANEALQVHGGYGYLKDYGVEKTVRDLRVHQILEGTNEIMRVVIARKVLGGNRG